MSLFWPGIVSAVLILEDRRPVFHFYVALSILAKVIQYKDRHMNTRAITDCTWEFTFVDFVVFIIVSNRLSDWLFIMPCLASYRRSVYCVPWVFQLQTP